MLRCFSFETVLIKGVLKPHGFLSNFHPTAPPGTFDCRLKYSKQDNCCSAFWLTHVRRIFSYTTAYLFEIVPLTDGFLLNLHPTAPLGVLLAVVPKQSNEKPNWQGLLRCISALTASEMLAMEQPLLCFHPCQNKNTTQNSLAPPTFHRLPKIRFSVRRIWKPNFPFAGKKENIGFRCGFS